VRVAEGAEPEPEEELFVVKDSSKIFTMAQLFDNEIPKSKCWTLPEAAARSRDAISRSLGRAQEHEAVYSSGVAAIEAKLATLSDNRSTTRAQINDEVDRLVAHSHATLTAAAIQRKETLQADLEADYDAQHKALQEQHTIVKQQHSSVARICTESASAHTKSDLEVVRLQNTVQDGVAANLASVFGEEKRVDPADGEPYTRDDFVYAYGGTAEWDAAQQLTVAAVAPVRQAQISAIFDTQDFAGTVDALASQLSTFGVVGVEPPALTGYAASTTVGFVGRPIEPNQPQGVFPDGTVFTASGLLDGLVCDSTTGVITGKPTIEAAQRCTVVAANEAGRSPVANVDIVCKSPTEINPAHPPVTPQQFGAVWGAAPGHTSQFPTGSSDEILHTLLPMGFKALSKDPTKLRLQCGFVDGRFGFVEIALEGVFALKGECITATTTVKCQDNDAQQVKFMNDLLFGAIERDNLMATYLRQTPAPVPAPAPAPAPAPGPVGGGASPAYFHIDPANDRRMPFSEHDNAVIFGAQSAGLLAVPVSPVNLPNGAVLRFDVRFGANARSAKMPSLSYTGICQVNLANENTRIVERVDKPAPTPAPAPKPAPKKQKKPG
jgi:hypothetical protein